MTLKNNMSFNIKGTLLLAMALVCQGIFAQEVKNKPNVILIYVDDLGYGDLGSYGATQLKTPHLDRLASEGTRFTNGHSTSATCTPSRFALMTGVYPWRQQGTGILPGDAKLIVPVDKPSLPKVFKAAGYQTAVIGKWHLGLGTSVEKNWNEAIKPGPNEVGFDYSFIFPATADRVPTVFMENHHVVALDVKDPIQVDYKNKVGNDPTGKENPEMLKMLSSAGHGHNNTIVNGIGRIGYMSGGVQSRWVDEELTTTFFSVAQQFIQDNKSNPFFLFFAMTEPHVPRMPATFFKGKSGLGLRGDAILQLDWTIGQLMTQLHHLGIDDNTIIVFSSDNGPVLDDGYEDEAVTLLNGHLPAGPLRGGKYSIFEGGTRVPLIVHGKGVAKNKVSDALISQVDFIASMAELLGQETPKEALDSKALLQALLGHTDIGRDQLIQHAGTLAIQKGKWKYIEPSQGRAYDPRTAIELGNDTQEQLYDLEVDLGEKQNVAKQYPKVVKDLKLLLEKEKAAKL